MHDTFERDQDFNQMDIEITHRSNVFVTEFLRSYSPLIRTYYTQETAYNNTQFNNSCLYAYTLISR